MNTITQFPRPRAAVAFTIAIACLTLVSAAAACNRPAVEKPAPTRAEVAAELTKRGRPTPLAGGARLGRLAVFPAVDEPLRVIQTAPEDGTKGVAGRMDEARIVVQFNHPVVPLAGLDDSSKQAAPITVEPAVKGSGAWLNDGTYVFTPSEDLLPATDYRVQVAAGLKDALGGVLAEAFAFGFTSDLPRVEAFDVGNNTSYVPVRATLILTFTTAMDVPSVATSVKLLSRDGGEDAGEVKASLSWPDERTLVVKPDAPLEHDRFYVLRVPATVTAGGGAAAMTEDYELAFHTVAEPKFDSIPADGTTDPSRSIAGQSQVEFHLGVPMAEGLITATVRPTVSNFSTWLSSDANSNLPTTVMVGGYYKPRTDYVVTLAADSQTQSGETLGKDISIRFRAGSLAPAVTVQPYDYGDALAPLRLVNAYRTPRLVVDAVNVPRFDMMLHDLSAATLLTLTTGPGRWEMTPAGLLAGNIPRARWTIDSTAPADVTRRMTPTVAAPGTGELAPGAYVVRISRPGAAYTQPLVATRLNLAMKLAAQEALVWATDLATGKPVAGQAIALYEKGGDNLLGRDTTDADGVARIAFAPRVDAWEPVAAVAEEGGQVVGLTTSMMSDGIEPSWWNLAWTTQPMTRTATVYTDRPIYRPGQRVYFRGIVRRDDDATLRLPEERRVKATVTDGQGRRVYDVELDMSSFGTVSGQLDLAPSAALGSYTVELDVPGGGDVVQYLASQTFTVAAYRKPEYEVEVTSAEAEYVQGASIAAKVKSTYYFGGPVAGAKVHWRVLKSAYTFAPPDLEGWWDFVDADLAASDRPVPSGEVKAEGEGTLNADGELAFTVPADLDDFPGSQVFTLDAEVTDLNNQSVSGRSSAVVHAAELYVGLQPASYVGRAGEPAAVNVLTLDTKGQAAGRRTVKLQYARREWFSVREKLEDGNFYWTSRFSDTVESEGEVQTDDQGMAEASFTPRQGGQYRVIATAVDGRRHTATSATSVWVSDEAVVAWQADNNDRVKLVPDKKTYRPGETAHILVPAPFAGAEALVTLERGTIRSVRHTVFEGNSETLDVPITDDLAPNVYVSVMMVKGVGPDSPLPQFKLGYAKLIVDAPRTRLDVSLSIAGDGKAMKPRDTVTATITATDADGKPVRAELSLAAVDKALLALVDDPTQPLEEVFYGERMLGVQTTSSSTGLAERLYEQLASERKGGGGGLEGSSTVRRSFQDTAFWKADVVTQSDGKATVSFVLPDNLTTWRLAARGVTAAAQVGSASTEVLVTKDILVRPVLPRFMIVGDTPVLEAVVTNQTAKAVEATLSLRTIGLQVAADDNQKLSVPAKGSGKVRWPVSVPPTGLNPPAVPGALGAVAVQMAVTGNGFEDTVELAVPVYRPASAETVATSGEVEARTVEPIEVPKNAVAGLTELHLELNPSLAAAALTSLDWLEAFPYDCSEQTVSKFLPNIATYQALQATGRRDPALQEKLSRTVNGQIQRLYNLQGGDGGWGWWSASASQPWLSAYALMGLQEARAAELTVDGGVVDHARDYLVAVLDGSSSSPAGDQRDQDEASAESTELEPDLKAFIAYVLSNEPEFAASRAVVLLEDRARLTPFGTALLILTLAKSGDSQAEAVQTLLADLTGQAVQSAGLVHWEGASDAEPSPRRAMEGPVRTTAAALMAISTVRPDSNLVPAATRWLLNQRRDGHWATTQETAWALLALTTVLKTSGDQTAGYSYTVEVVPADPSAASLGIAGSAKGTVSSNTLDQPITHTFRLTDAAAGSAHELVMQRQGQGRLYYNASLRYALPSEGLAPFAQGLILGRQYLKVDAKTLKPTTTAVDSAKVGEYLAVRLTLVVPSTTSYLLLEDHLPAGFEAVDNSLKTTTAAASGPTFEEAGEEGEEVPWWMRPWWGYWVESQLLDDRVAAFADELPAGTFTYTYLIRASAAGTFNVLPARAEAMYAPEVFGRSSAGEFVVEP